MGPLLFGLRAVAGWARRSLNLESSRDQGAQGNLFLPRHLLSRRVPALDVGKLLMRAIYLGIDKGFLGEDTFPFTRVQCAVKHAREALLAL